MVLTETVIYLDHDQKLRLSTGWLSLVQDRRQYQYLFKTLKNSFMQMNNSRFTGIESFLKDLTSNRHVDRLQILLSVLSVSWLLRVSKLTSRTGKCKFNLNWCSTRMRRIWSRVEKKNRDFFYHKNAVFFPVFIFYETSSINYLISNISKVFFYFRWSFKL